MEPLLVLRRIKLLWVHFWVNTDQTNLLILKTLMNWSSQPMLSLKKLFISMQRTKQLKIQWMYSKKLLKRKILMSIPIFKKYVDFLKSNSNKCTTWKSLWALVSKITLDNSRCKGTPSNKCNLKCSNPSMPNNSQVNTSSNLANINNLPISQVNTDENYSSKV